MSTAKAHLSRSSSRIYTCPACDKTFGKNSHLIRHFIVHTGERNHICPYCNRGFTQPHHLKSHVNSQHLHVKPLACGWPGCDMSFADQGTRSKHRNKAHGSRILRKQRSLDDLRAALANAPLQPTATDAGTSTTKALSPPPPPPPTLTLPPPPPQQQSTSVQGSSVDNSLIRQPSTEIFVPTTRMEVDGAPASRQSLSIGQSSFAYPDADGIFKNPPQLYYMSPQGAWTAVTHTPSVQPNEAAPTTQNQQQLELPSMQTPFPTQDAYTQASAGFHPTPTMHHPQHFHSGNLDAQPRPSTYTTAHTHMHCPTCTCSSTYPDSANQSAYPAPPTCNTTTHAFPTQQYPQRVYRADHLHYAPVVHPNEQGSQPQWGLQRRRSFASSVQPIAGPSIAQDSVALRQRAYSFHHSTNANNASSATPAQIGLPVIHGQITLHQERQQNTLPALNFTPLQQESTPLDNYAMLRSESFARRNSMSSMRSSDSELTCSMADWDAQSIASNSFGMGSQPNLQFGTQSVQNNYAIIPGTDTPNSSGSIF